MPRATFRSHSPTHRIERVGELIRHAMSEIIARGEIVDEALDRRPVTVTSVRMSPDLKVATVSVMPLGGEQSGATIEALERHKKELRALVARRVNLKFAPALRFSLDWTFAAQARIDALLKSPEVARDLDHDRRGTDEDQA